MTERATFNLEFESFRAFVDEYSPRLADHGLFLPTHEPEPVGSVVEFSLSLSDEFRLLQGTGEVVWTLAEVTELGSPGMAVRILEADESTRRLLDRLIDNHRKKGGEPFSLEPPPGAVTAPAEVAAESPEAPVGEAEGDAVMRAPSIDLGQAIDLSGTIPIGPHEAVPPALEEEPAPTLGTDEDAPAAAALDEEAVGEAVAPEAEPEGAEPAGEEADLLSVPEISGAGEESGAEEVDLLETNAEPPLGERADATESLFDEEDSGALVPPLDLDEDGEVEAWLPPGASEAEGGRPWLKIAMVLLVLAAALFAVGVYLGDFVSDRRAGEVESAGSPEAEVPGEDETPPVVLAENDSPAAVATGTEEGAEATEETAPPGPDAEAAPAAESGPLTGIDRLSWRDTGEGTVLVLEGDGRIEPSAFDVLRVSSGSPRAVIKVRGVSRPFATATTPVGTDQVRQVRSGFHVLPEGSEVHFVADLTGPAVEIAVASVEGRRLRVRFSGG